jgi:hypothetical protein
MKFFFCNSNQLASYNFGPIRKFRSVILSSSRTSVAVRPSLQWAWTIVKTRRNIFAGIVWTSEMLKMMENSGQVVRTFGPGSKDPWFKSINLPPHVPMQLDWFIKGRVVCGLSVIHATWDRLKKRREFPRSRASNSVQSCNHLGLGFIGTQLQWYA